MKKIIILLALFSLNNFGKAQDRNTPVFSNLDSLNAWGPWEKKTYKGNKGEDITISFRFKVRSKFVMACLYTIEVRNDSETDFKAHFRAGNYGTNYYNGEIGMVREKIKLKPKESKEINYRLPVKNNDKKDTDDQVCKKCKENDHAYDFVQ